MRRAFTLLEILISVVVLAIGLVGVVAIFPAVIDLQRRAQDVVIGTAAASSAEATLVGTFVENKSLDWNSDWDEVFNSNPFTRKDLFPVFDILRLDPGISVRDARVPVGASGFIYDFLWDVRWEWERQRNTDTEQVLVETGDLVLGGGRSYKRFLENNVEVTLPEVTLGLGQRLMPDAASGQDPRYVYDMVVRRVDAGIGFSPRGGSGTRTYEKQVQIARLPELPIQIAVFVRRVDRNIRTPLGVSLREAITGVNDDPDDSDNIRDADRRLPLAVDNDNFARVIQNGKPGEHSYSRPIQALLRDTTISETKEGSGVFDLFDPYSLRFNEPNVVADTAATSLTQVGQLFVDNQGVVRQVVSIVERDSPATAVLRVDPPFSTDSLDEFRQIVFTPQVPVGIRVITTR